MTDTGLNFNSLLQAALSRRPYSTTGDLTGARTRIIARLRKNAIDLKKEVPIMFPKKGYINIIRMRGASEPSLLLRFHP